jgi:hypothetical protein
VRSAALAHRSVSADLEGHLGGTPAELSDKERKLAIRKSF